MKFNTSKRPAARRRKLLIEPKLWECIEIIVAHARGRGSNRVRKHLAARCLANLKGLGCAHIETDPAGNILFRASERLRGSTAPETEPPRWLGYYGDRP